MTECDFTVHPPRRTEPAISTPLQPTKSWAPVAQPASPATEQALAAAALAVKAKSEFFNPRGDYGFSDGPCTLDEM